MPLYQAIKVQKTQKYFEQSTAVRHAGSWSREGLTSRPARRVHNCFHRHCHHHHHHPPHGSYLGVNNLRVLSRIRSVVGRVIELSPPLQQGHRFPPPPQLLQGPDAATISRLRHLWRHETRERGADGGICRNGRLHHRDAHQRGIDQAGEGSSSGNQPSR